MDDRGTVQDQLIESISFSDAGASLVDRMPSPTVVAKVGIKKLTPLSLVARMPSPDIAAKVGAKNATPASLANRMPSPEIAAKVGRPIELGGSAVRRVQRRNAR